MKEITLEQWYMGRKEKYKAEWNEDIEKEAQKLLSAVNALLIDLKWEGELTVSSGWRPPTVNSGVKGAAKKSAHMTGEALDIADVNQRLGKVLLEKKELLSKHNLYLENPEKTTTWVHLQTRRTGSGNRVFNP